MNKRKNTSEHRRFSLNFQRQFSFYSPYSIDLCLVKLRARSERKPSFFQPEGKLLITTQQVDADHHTFRLEQTTWPANEVIVRGALAKVGSKTYVSGNAELGGVTLFFFVMLPILGLIVYGLAVLISRDFLGGCIGGGVGMIPSAAMICFLLAANIEKNQLYKLIVKVLDGELEQSSDLATQKKG